ncbi:NEDD8-activating enzyme E1 regulatory subunit [Aphelenchoides bicaudatus]|nr:NEDD8-activating enzyme E1 regulatory subunit [Aphelenchoides bicaudatus]
MGIDMADELPDRYDRQVRLWGEQGQKSIGQTSVAVIGSSALATEILKSLVLAGIGSYKIFDDELVQESDTGNNFFVSRADLNKPRAEVVTASLNELNPSVKGCYSRRNFNTSSSLAVLNDFSLVIGAQLPMDSAEYVADYLYKRNIPFVWANTVGLVGYFRLSYREHEILHDHRELPPHDFRLQAPFSTFQEFGDKMDLENMKHEQHSHIPYVVLLLKTLQIWRTEINDSTALPTNYKARKEFTKILMDMQKLNEQGIYNEDNFEEGKHQIIRSFAGIEPNENVKQLFNDPRSSSLSETAEALSLFWLYVAAVKQFYTTHGYLPLSGSLPDMTSDTNTYTTLVNLFREQALKEAEEIHNYTIELSKKHQIDDLKITFSETVNYCKNFSRLGAVTGTNLADELKKGNLQQVFTSISEYLQANPSLSAENGQMNGDGSEKSPEVCPLVWLVILRAAEFFFKGKNRFPGTNGVPCALDAGDLFERVKKLLDEQDSKLVENLEALIPMRAIEEVCRYGNAELNAVVSILGGVVAQEVIKLCTQQYVPVDNTFVFDGNTQKSTTIRL